MEQLAVPLLLGLALNLRGHPRVLDDVVVALGGRGAQSPDALGVESVALGAAPLEEFLELGDLDLDGRLSALGRLAQSVGQQLGVGLLALEDLEPPPRRRVRLGDRYECVSFRK